MRREDIHFHVRRAFPDGWLGDKTVIEIGLVDSLTSAVMAKAHGAAAILLVEAVRFASRELSSIAIWQLPWLIAEMHRALKQSSWISHNIDFQDHFAHGLNNLWFSEKA